MQCPLANPPLEQFAELQPSLQAKFHGLHNLSDFDKTQSSQTQGQLRSSKWECHTTAPKFHTNGPREPSPPDQAKQVHGQGASSNTESTEGPVLVVEKPTLHQHRSQTASAFLSASASTPNIPMLVQTNASILFKSFQLFGNCA